MESPFFNTINMVTSSLAKNANIFTHLAHVLLPKVVKTNPELLDNQTCASIFSLVIASLVMIACFNTECKVTTHHSLEKYSPSKLQ